MDLKDLDTEILVRVIKELIIDYLKEPCYGTETRLVDAMLIFIKKIDKEQKPIERNSNGT